MIAQEIFDTVVRHLAQQGHKALRRGVVDNACAYRAPDGSKCAVGCLIPDDLYRFDFEGENAWVVARELEHELPWLKAHGDLLGFLQSVHDNWPVEDWPSKLTRLAADFSLSSAVVAECFPEAR